MTDCCIIGGGIIGLSIARELAGRGLSVRVLSRESPRHTASWAAAGIFPPAPAFSPCTPDEAFTAWSDRLQRQWAAELLEETGIDNGLRPCGGLHVAHDEAAVDSLRTQSREWLRKGARCDWLDAAAVAACEPALAAAVDRGLILGGYALTDEMQIRPPRHLDALVRSCQARGVEVSPDCAVDSLEVRGGRIAAVRTTDGRVQADLFCLTAGAWSGTLGEAMGLRIETRPIRGQIALLRLPARILSRVVNQGLEYLVPREDGRLLVGSTIEDAGFDASTTPRAIDGLLAFARRLLGDLADATLEQSWAGLRPGSADGLPFIGLAPTCMNGFVATGHFRAGLHQSTGTAVLMADLMSGCSPTVDPAPFSPSRPMPPRSPGDTAAPRGSVGDYLARAAAAAKA